MADDQNKPDPQGQQQPPEPPAAPAMAVVDVKDLREALRDKPPEGPTGPNATTEPKDPAAHYVLAADGKTKLNAYGEEKGSSEDRRRMAALGYS